MEKARIENTPVQYGQLNSASPAGLALPAGLQVDGPGRFRQPGFNA